MARPVPASLPFDFVAVRTVPKVYLRRGLGLDGTKDDQDNGSVEQVLHCAYCSQVAVATI